MGGSAGAGGSGLPFNRTAGAVDPPLFASIRRPPLEEQHVAADVDHLTRDRPESPRDDPRRRGRDVHDVAVADRHVRSTSGGESVEVDAERALLAWTEDAGHGRTVAVGG